MRSNVVKEEPVGDEGTTWTVGPQRKLNNEEKRDLYSSYRICY